MVNDDHFIILDMLEQIESFDELKPEHTSELLAFPTIITFAMASIFDKERATLLLERGRETDQTGNIEVLGHVANEFLGISRFLECPLFPPADNNLLFANLMIGMATYILFCKVLAQHLENDRTDQVVEWSGRWDKFPPDGRFDSTLSLMWLGKMINLAILRLNEALNAQNDEDFILPYVPLPVVTLLQGDGDENADEDSVPVYCHLVGLHPEDEEGNPKEYTLWTVFYQTDDESIEFQFRPQWNIEEVPFRKKLCELLLLIEHDVRITFNQLRESWEDFAGRLEDYASKEENAANQMMNKFIGIDYLVDTSLEYPAFRKSVASLDWNFEENETFKQVSKKYKNSKKKHITPKLMDSLREAMPAIRELWKKFRDTRFDDQKTSEYIRENHDKFFFMTPSFIAKHGTRYHDERTGERKFIIDCLVTVSARKGHQLSNTIISTLLDSGDILRKAPRLQ
jgi:hypothetical protein